MFVTASKQRALDLSVLLRAAANTFFTGSCEVFLDVPALTSPALGPFEPPSTPSGSFFMGTGRMFSILPRQTPGGRVVQVILKTVYTKPALCLVVWQGKRLTCLHHCFPGLAKDF